jgi:hypothetical protein
MSYCLPTNQIGNYAPGNSNISTRNIDCVTIDVDTADIQNLTVDGLSVSGDLTTALNATQNQTAIASPQTTTFAGSVTADQVYTNTLLTDTITAPSGTLTINNNVTSVANITTTGAISVNNTTATSTTQLAQFLEPNQTSGTTEIVIGKSTSTNNSLKIQHVYTSSGSTSNYGQLALANGSGPQIYSTYTNIPNNLQVNGVVAIPRQIGTLTTMTGSGAGITFPFSFTTTSNVQRIIVNVVDMVGNGAASSIPLVQYGYNGTYVTASGNTYVGITYGNNGGAILQWANTGIPLWNQTAGLNTNYKISGSIEFQLAGSVTGAQRWVIKGMMGTPDSVSTAGPYYVYFQGVLNCPGAFPNFTNLRIACQASTVLTGGYCNILYY